MKHKKKYEKLNGNRVFADLKYGEEDSISPNTLFFSCHKGLTQDI